VLRTGVALLGARLGFEQVGAPGAPGNGPRTVAVVVALRLAG